MPHHLEPVPPGPADEPLRSLWSDDDATAYEDDPGGLEGEVFPPVARPTWWRWVAIAVIVAMVLAGPFAYVLSKLLS